MNEEGAGTENENAKIEEVRFKDVSCDGKYFQLNKFTAPVSGSVFARSYSFLGSR